MEKSSQTRNLKILGVTLDLIQEEVHVVFEDLCSKCKIVKGFLKGSKAIGKACFKLELSIKYSQQCSCDCKIKKLKKKKKKHFKSMLVSNSRHSSVKRSSNENIAKRSKIHFASGATSVVTLQNLV